MFAWLKWGKPDHPLANAKKVSEQIAALPSNDPVRALERITTWLDALSHAREFSLKLRWEIVDLLDRGSIGHRRKIEQQYVSAPRMGHAEEDRLWTAAFAFWRMLGGSYVQCVENFRSGAPGAQAVRSETALIAGRALRTGGRQLKWTFLRQGEVAPHLWRELGSAYVLAEGQGVAATRILLYPEEHGPTSAQEELLKALMLAASSPYSLVSSKLHVAERVIAHVAGRFVLKDQLSPECGFAFDLAAARAPARLQQEAREKKAGATMRYFGPGEAEAAINELMRETRMLEAVPSEVNLGGQFDQQSFLWVLAHLARIWDSRPPVRRSVRSEDVTRVTVVPGFPNILRCLEVIASGASLDPRTFVEQETWTVCDKSERGYGALVPERRRPFDYDPLTGFRAEGGDWLHVGSLLALREETTTAWRLGVVRRIVPHADTQRRIGIELFAGTAVAIRLAPATEARPPPTERRRSAMLLSGAPGGSDEVLVLMRAGHFTGAQRFVAHLDDNEYVLLPAERIEGGEDFDCARYTLKAA